MPSIQIDEKTLKKVKERKGVYNSLSRKQESIKTINVDKLKKYVTAIIKTSFREYAFAHKGMTNELFEKEWNRFNKFLQKNL